MNTKYHQAISRTLTSRYIIEMATLKPTNTKRNYLRTELRKATTHKRIRTEQKET